MSHAPFKELFTKVIQKDGSLSFQNFLQETGIVVAQKRQGDLVTITLEADDTIPGPKVRYESFIFERELLHYKKGYRNLSGRRVGLSMKRLSWTWRGKSYRITSEGTKIIKIGH